MPFGLKNAGVTFQRAMDIAFSKEIHDFLVIYLDDLTPFSKSDQEHIKHLRQIFLKCRKYGISLNPKKSLFGLEEGKLLGHIISKDGIRIDPDRIQAILQMPHPRNVKELQGFLGKINFLRRFIPNLAELIRLLNNMLKKDSKVKWTVEANQAFEGIKLTLTQTPVLTNPQFDREFIIFSFASQHTIAAVLLQKDDQGNEKPIAFFSRALRDAPLKYQIMEKQAYALVKAIKDFRIYILYSHVIAYVPSPIVKDILTQENLEGRRGKWIANILEFDIEIKPTKLIKGQGLAKLMSETNFQALDINQLDSEWELATPKINEFDLEFEKSKSKKYLVFAELMCDFPRVDSETVTEEPIADESLFLISTLDPWYGDIITYLQTQTFWPDLSRSDRRKIRFQSQQYKIIGDTLYRLGADSIF
eukprot:PITA_05904